MGVEEKKIHMIHNAIEDYWFENTQFDFTQDPRIVFLGRIGNDAFSLKLKGIDRVIDIYQHFLDIKKTMVCITTNKGIVSWFLNNMQNNSLFINLKKDSIPKLLSSVSGSILFLSSRYEGFSLSLVEGMSQGLVPVSYPVGVAPEIISDGKNGFIVHSQKEAKEKIALLLADTELRKRCAKGAMETAKLFSSEIIVEQLLELYKKMKS